VAGNVAPEAVNPVPTSVTELTVTAAVPIEVNVSVLVECAFSVTLPKSKLLALNDN
jgi:hypothetical protein